jgi:ATP-dependent RNA helicase DDX5/DBP2
LSNDRTKDILDKMRDQRDQSKTIIFTGTKRNADDLTRDLSRDGYRALAIHGDKKQPERDWVMNQFKSGKVPILIATDVAARGLGKYINCIYVLHAIRFILAVYIL